MIPIYTAFEFNRILPEGSTFPWVVQADINGEAVALVVKMYKEKHLEHDTYMKECMAYSLAKEFEISTPKACFVEFSRDFHKTLSPNLLSQWKASGMQNTKFATEYITPNLPYSPSVTHNILDAVDMQNIYAFDNLILHRDRNLHRPNIFVNNKKYYIIDHESAFATTRYNIDNYLKNNNWHYHTDREHIFYSYVKGLRGEAKSGIFDTFEYYLAELVDLSNLDFICDQLMELGHPVESFFDVMDYLKIIKQTSGKFVNHLRDKLK